MIAQPVDAGSAALSNALAAALFAVDPVGLGGVVLRSRAGAERDAWLTLLKRLLPVGQALRRIPLHINDDRLLGGLDLAATLQAGRPIAMRGLLAEADGGVVLLAMAERVGPACAAGIAAVLDSQQVVVERHGVGTRHPSRCRADCAIGSRFIWRSRRCPRFDLTSISTMPRTSSIATRSMRRVLASAGC